MDANQTPGLIAKLIADVEAAGGQAIPDGERKWEIRLPRTFQDADGVKTVHQQIAGHVGFFRRDGQAHVRGTIDVRKTAKTWKIAL